MKSDYPAAHSMDTTWFAVDEDGRVGLFDSGEAGAVPIEAASAGGAAEPSFDLFPLQALLAARAIESGAEREKDPPASEQRDVRIVVALEPAAPTGDAAIGYRSAPASVAESRIDVPTVVIRESNPRIVMTTKPVSATVIRELARSDEVVALLTEYDVSASFHEVDVGLFRYSNDFTGAPGTYRSQEKPAAPVRLEDLPKTIADQVALLHFPVRFAEKDHIELADYMTDERVAMYAENVTLRGEKKPTVAAAARPRDWRGLIVIVVIALVIVVAALLARR